MNTTKFTQEVSQAVKQIADKYDVNIKINKIAKANDHMESVLLITNKPSANIDKVVIKDKTLSRSQQVKKFFDKGIKSANLIANKIGSHPSYVSRLLRDLKNNQTSVMIH